MTHAYRVPVFGGRADATEGLRARVARGRPNWWVILAVSLGLMALLVATAGGTPRANRRGGGSARAAAHVGLGPDADQRAGSTKGASRSTTATTTTTATPTIAPAPSSSAPAGGGTALLSSGTPPALSTPAPAATSVTTTTQAPPAATTTTEPSAVPADRTQGYLDPPLQTSNQYGFTGTGAMEISVVWSGDTYLTMEVSCANGSQNVGGTSAMAAALPDATGSCLATVSEPASETTSLTYTISIGPSGG
jgi:hypothetical protein